MPYAHHRHWKTWLRSAAAGRSIEAHDSCQTNAGGDCTNTGESVPQLWRRVFRGAGVLLASLSDLLSGRVARRARRIGGFRLLPQAEVFEVRRPWTLAARWLLPTSAERAWCLPVRSSSAVGRPPRLFHGCGTLSGLVAGFARGFGGWWVLLAGGGFEVRRPPTLVANCRFLGPRALAGSPGRWELPAGARHHHCAGPIRCRGPLELAPDSPGGLAAGGYCL